MMPWVRLDEGFPEHPKVLAAGPSAAWLHVCAIAYCNRNLTDGRLPVAALPRLSQVKRPAALAEQLVEVGLWERARDGFVIHDYLTYQPSRASVDAERAKARDRMARVRGSAPVRPNRSDDVRPNNGVDDGACSPEVRSTRPDPTRPDVNKTTDNSRLGTRNGSLSSSVEQLIKITAYALGLKDRANPGARFVAGIERNLRAERLDEIVAVDALGYDLEGSVTKLVGDGAYARMAIEARS